MNITAINNLADFLDNIPASLHKGFNMNTYDDDCLASLEQTNVEFDCKTIACIAGWTCAVVKPDGKIAETIKSVGEIEYFNTAKQLLALSEHQAMSLFGLMTQNWYWYNLGPSGWGNVKPQQAAQVLRILAQTGEVRWNDVLTGTSNLV